MNSFDVCNRSTLEQYYSETLAKFDACKAKKLKLNMSRGKPSDKQLDIAAGVLTTIQTPADCYD